MLLWALLLFLPSLVPAQRPVKNNAAVDQMLSWHNELLTRLGFGLTAIPNVTLGDIKLYEGVQVGMNSLYRTGDCFVFKLGPQTVVYSNQIGYRLLAYAFGNITYQSDVFSGVILIRENSLQMDYTVHNETGNCFVTLDTYRYLEFSDVKFVGSLKKYSEGGDLDEDSLFGEEGLLVLANGLLGQERPAMERHLQALCQGPLKELPPAEGQD